MKKNLFQEKRSQLCYKLSLKMKLSVLFTFLALLTLHANNSYAQRVKITLNLENVSVAKLLDEIESKTDFRFVYQKKDVDLNRKVSVSVDKEKVVSILDRIFKNTDTTYKIFDKQIFLVKLSNQRTSLHKNHSVIGYTQTSQFQISGNVTDGNNAPLPGANIIEKGTSNGVIADFDGNFSINLNDENATLVVSYLGYATREIQVIGQSDLTIVLEESTSGLDEVVVVGYGSVKKKDLTGSISSVTTEEFKLTPLKNFSTMLQGTMTGLSVVQSSAPGGNAIIRIRGGNSMIGSSEPLYIVDGFPSWDIGNPNDIESIQVLKDASATAIYGSRGANGVVIITTKRGKIGKPTLGIQTYSGIQIVRNKLELLNAKEYVEFANEKASNIGRPPYFPDTSDIPGDTDWQDEIFAAAPVSSFSLSATGGDEKNKYAVLGNYLNQDGIIINSGFSSLQIRTNLDNKLSNWLNISTSISMLHSQNNQAFISASASSLVYRALQSPPVAPVFDENGDYFPIRDFAVSDPLWDNPRAITDGTSIKNVTNSFNGNTNFEFSLSDYLKFNVRLGGKYLNSRNDTYLERITLDGGNGGRAIISESDTYGTLIENILSYKRIFNDNHDFNFTAGFTSENNVFTRFEARASDFINDDLKTDNISSAAVFPTPSSFKTENSILSWLGRINYILDNKYLLTLSARADGSSRLGSNNKWGIFPSAAIAWRLSEENFMREIQTISNLKLRVSYGSTGNQEIGNGLSLSRLSDVQAIQGINEDLVIGYVPSILENNDLKWEVTNQFDVGFDLGLFENRVDLTFDYYSKVTSDLLSTVPLPLSSGFTFITKNFGEMKNKGMEVGINSHIINNDHWTWSAGANFSLNRNEVTEVATASGEFFAEQLGSPINASVNIIKEGYPLSSMYGYIEDGLWESDQTTGSIQPNAKAGDQRYLDINNDGMLTSEDREILGIPYPDFVYGFNTNLTYKNFGLFVLMQGSEGGLIFNANKYSVGDSFARNGNQLREVKNHWSQDNPNPEAQYPRLSNVAPLVSNRFFEDASYLRFKTISLSCNLNSKDVSWIKDATIYISGENLFTFTNYSGYDPEVSSTSGNSLVKGVDVGAYPSSKTYTIGLNLSL